MLDVRITMISGQKWHALFDSTAEFEAFEQAVEASSYGSMISLRARPPGMYGEGTLKDVRVRAAAVEHYVVRG